MENLSGVLSAAIARKYVFWKYDDPGILNDIDTPEDYRKALCLI